jgi:hypothetical protein
MLVAVETARTIQKKPFVAMAMYKQNIRKEHSAVVQKVSTQPK